MPNTPAKYPAGGRAPSRTLGALQWLDSYIEAHVSQRLDELLGPALARHRNATRPPPLIGVGPPDMPIVAGHTDFTVSIPVQIAFRPLRLVVDPDCARSFSITALRSGNVFWTAGFGHMPASVFVPPQFVPDASAGELARLFNNLEGAPIVGVSQAFFIGVRNLAPDARAFRCCVFGEPIEAV